MSGPDSERTPGTAYGLIPAYIDHDLSVPTDLGRFIMRTAAWDRLSRMTRMLFSADVRIA